MVQIQSAEEKLFGFPIFNLNQPPHYGLTGRPIKNAKVPKKVRNGAQKSGMMTRNLEHQLFSSVIENYIRYSALHQIFCITVPSSGCILFHS